MEIKDRIYGTFNVEDKVIVDLINSGPMQRLKKISQDGAPHYIQPVRNVTRFEHSVGVWYLARKFGLSLEGQIASLLHDVPHTAFSHVIDFVFVNEKHEFHEKFAEKIIKESEIPEILSNHNIGLSEVLNKENFDLLENNLPNVSIDRLDYFLRDGFALGFLPTVTVNDFLSNLKVDNDKLYFEDHRLASQLAILYLSFSRLIWLDPTSHGAFFLVSEAIKAAFDKGLLTENDLFKDDEVVMRILRDANLPEINKYLDRLTPEHEFEYATKEEAEFYGLNKPRSVDPLVKTPCGLKRVSELVPSLGYYFREFSEKYKYLGVKTRNDTK